MKYAKLFLLPLFGLLLLTFTLPIPGQGQFLIGTLLQTLSDARRVAAQRNQQIKMSQDLVNSIYDDDVSGRITPESDPAARTPNERVRDLKEGIKGELAKAKANQIVLESAVKQLQQALDRYTKNPTENNLKNAQALVTLINKYKNDLDGNFEIIKTMIAQISKIRTAYDDKEWNNPEGKYKDERQALADLWNRLKAVVPNVVGKTYQQAVEDLGAAGLVVAGVEVTRAPNQESSEKVIKQAPKGGEPLPANRSVKLWHYDRFGSTRSQGFQRGDAQRVDGRFAAFTEIISPDGKAIYLQTNQIGLSWGITKLGSRAEALEKINEINRHFAALKGFWQKSAGEKIVKGRTSTAEESMYWETWRMSDGKTPPHTYYNHNKLHRDVFIISYGENSKKFDDNLAVHWAPILEKSKQLIEERFPPEGLAISRGNTLRAQKVGD